MNERSGGNVREWLDRFGYRMTEAEREEARRALSNGRALRHADGRVYEREPETSVRTISDEERASRIQGRPVLARRAVFEYPNPDLEDELTKLEAKAHSLFKFSEEYAVKNVRFRAIVENCDWEVKLEQLRLQTNRQAEHNDAYKLPAYDRDIKQGDWKARLDHLRAQTDKLKVQTDRLEKSIAARR